MLFLAFDQHYTNIFSKVSKYCLGFGFMVLRCLQCIIFIRHFIHIVVRLRREIFALYLCCRGSKNYKTMGGWQWRGTRRKSRHLDTCCKLSTETLANVQEGGVWYDQPLMETLTHPDQNGLKCKDIHTCHNTTQVWTQIRFNRYASERDIMFWKSF